MTVAMVSRLTAIGMVIAMAGTAMAVGDPAKRLDRRQAASVYAGVRSLLTDDAIACPRGGDKKGTGHAEALGRSRGGFTTRLHTRCDAQGRPPAFVSTPGQAHDVHGFRPSMRMAADRIDALLADEGGAAQGSSDA